jgi:hypothetical protein
MQQYSFAQIKAVSADAIMGHNTMTVFPLILK